MNRKRMWTRALMGVPMVVMAALSACTGSDMAADVEEKSLETPAASMKTVAYKADDAVIFNPERGIFKHYEFPSDAPRVITKKEIDKLKKDNESLIFAMFVLRDFRDKEISADYLSLFRQNMAALRAGGMKAVVRFCYTVSEDDKPWDAPWSLTKRHIEQLRPLLMENADVIAVLEAGFIGVWGEWHYTDHYQQSPKPGQFATHREMVLSLLNALPKDRAVAVRYPRAKMGIFDIQASDTLTEATAFSGTDLSRVAFHNDCFLANDDDMGTFRHKPEARQYWLSESKYLSMGGETCAPSEYTEVPNALKDFSGYHWTYLNKSYHPYVLQKWEREGFMETIKKRLGYRLVLQQATYTDAPKAGESFRLSLQIANEGWAAPINKRHPEVIFQGKTKRYRIALSNDIRRWYAGETHRLETAFALPADMPAGDYEVYLNLPDAYSTLHDNPEFSIRLANTGVWNAETGYNKLFKVSIGAGSKQALPTATATLQAF